MSNNQKDDRSLRNHSALKKLLDDLSRLNNKAIRTSIRDQEMLSFLLDEANKGIDISERYPTLYQKLLIDPYLRRAFLDILEAIDDEDENSLNMILAAKKKDLNFLKKTRAKRLIEELHGKWKISWQRTVSELQSVFSPSELVYRSEHSLLIDPWFILLRDEVEIEKTLFTVLLECTLAKDDNQALSPLLNIAVSVRDADNGIQFPVKITIQWGMYKEFIHVEQEGSTKFPNIPFRSIFEEDNKINADLALTIESTS